MPASLRLRASLDGRCCGLFGSITPPIVKRAKCRRQLAVMPPRVTRWPPHRRARRGLRPARIYAEPPLLYHCYDFCGQHTCSGHFRDYTLRQPIIAAGRLRAAQQGRRSNSRRAGFSAERFLSAGRTPRPTGRTPARGRRFLARCQSTSRGRGPAGTIRHHSGEQ